MALPGKKPGLMIAIGMGKGRPPAGLMDHEGDEPDHDEAEESAEPHEVAAREVWDAIQSKDFDSFKEAFHAYVSMCVDSASNDGGESSYDDEG